MKQRFSTLARAGNQGMCEGGVAAKALDGCCNGLRFVFNREARDAIFKYFPKAIDAAGNDGHTHTHGKQSSRAETFGARNVDKSRGVGEVFDEVVREGNGNTDDGRGACNEVAAFLGIGGSQGDEGCLGSPFLHGSGLDSIINDIDFRGGNTRFVELGGDEFGDRHKACGSSVFELGQRRGTDGERNASGHHEGFGGGDGGESMRASVVSMNDVVFGRKSPDGQERSRVNRVAESAGGSKERGACARKQSEGVAGRTHGFQQEQNLVLAAAEFATQIDVQDMQLESDLSARTHVASLGVFDEVVQSGHVGNGKAFGSVEETTLEDIGSEERPRRVE